MKFGHFIALTEEQVCAVKKYLTAFLPCYHGYKEGQVHRYGSGWHTFLVDILANPASESL